jgi:hypothetical protein
VYFNFICRGLFLMFFAACECFRKCEREREKGEGVANMSVSVCLAVCLAVSREDEGALQGFSNFVLDFQ